MSFAATRPNKEKIVDVDLVVVGAGLFGLTENTVKSRLFRLRAGLRDALLKEGIAV